MEKYEKIKTKEVKHVDLLTGLPKENSINTETLYLYLDKITQVINNYIFNPSLKPSVIDDFENQYELLKIAITEGNFIFAKTTLCRLRVVIGVIYLTLELDFPIIFTMFPEFKDIGKTLAEIEDQL